VLANIQEENVNTTRQFGRKTHHTRQNVFRFLVVVFIIVLYSTFFPVIDHHSS